jgi:hypothetical protein
MKTAVHIMRGNMRSAAHLNARQIVLCSDTLICGPSCVDASEHRLARVEYWGKCERSEQKELRRAVLSKTDLVGRLSTLTDQTTKVYLWVDTSDWANVAFLMWVADALSDTEAARGAVRIILRSTAELDNLITTERVTQVLNDSTLAADRFLAELASLWRVFASGSPLAFSSLLQRSNLDEADAFLGRYIKLFPRGTSAGVLLSRYDADLLKCLSTVKWTTPIELFEKLTSDLSYMPQEHSRGRLDEWACHRQESFVAVSRQNPKPASEWAAVSYRLTTRGNSVVNEGMSRLDDAPPMWIGGVNVYSTWCYDEEHRIFRPARE